MSENEKLNERIYKDVIQDLRLLIETKFGSVRKFSIETGIDRFNLSKIFSENHKNEMSIGTFVRICQGLGLTNSMLVDSHNVNSDISLKHYLSIDNNLILKLLLKISFH